jgi:hypothetical protein
MATFRATSNREESLASLVPGDIEVFEHDDFNTHDGDEDGWHFRTSLDIVNMGDFNDQASSVIIYTGFWEFYEHVEFNLKGTVEGYAVRLGPGYHGSLNSLGIINDTLSSFRRVG